GGARDRYVCTRETGDRFSKDRSKVNHRSRRWAGNRIGLCARLIDGYARLGSIDFVLGRQVRGRKGAIVFGSAGRSGQRLTRRIRDRIIVIQLELDRAVAGAGAGGYRVSSSRSASWRDVSHRGNTAQARGD